MVAFIILQQPPFTSKFNIFSITSHFHRILCSLQFSFCKNIHLQQFPQSLCFTVLFILLGSVQVEGFYSDLLLIYPPISHKMCIHPL